jgi:1,4-dihydroxy-2-naphthoate octaprenyltransferase
MVFLSFGVGMTLGSYYVQVKEFSWVPMLLSVPIGMLIIAILHSNNIRDMKFDRTFGVKTIPILIGESASKYMYDVLILGAYASIILFVVFGLLPWPALLNLVTLPAALKLIKMLKNIPEETLPRWELGTKHNIMTAQFNMQFGLMLNIGLLLAWFFLSR